MALKQAIRANKIKNLKKELEPLKARQGEIDGLVEKSAQELEEREFSEEELQEVEDLQVELEKEALELSEKIKELEGKIEGLQAENEEEIEEVINEEPIGETQRERREVTTMNKREQRLAYLNQPEVRGFYESLRDVILNKRALTDASLSIPVQVIDNLLPYITEESKFYKHVNVVKLNGSGRAILEGDNPEAIWTEMCDPVEELALSFKAVEIDGYKVGGYIPVCNAIIEDSMINLASYVESKLGTAIAKALDKAIVVGTGTKQPVGITNGRTPTKLADNELSTILVTAGAIKPQNLGTVKIAMNRADFYSNIFSKLFTKTDSGKVVIPTLNDLGFEVIESEYVPAGTFIIGDFKKYLLGERSDIKLSKSTDVRFIEDQTVFKATARYDGKPVDEAYFGYYEFAEEAPSV